MGFSNQERINLVTKALAAGVLDANEAAVWYETLFPFSFTLDARQVWTQYSTLQANPAANLAAAQANAAGALSGIIDDLSDPVDAVRLTEVPGTNQKTYAAYTTFGDVSSVVLNGWVQPQQAPQATGIPSNGYAVRLYNGDPNAGGVEILTTDGTTGTGASKTVGWIWNYANGLLLLSVDFFTETGIDPGTVDFYINGFRYIGTTAGENSTLTPPHAALESPTSVQELADYLDSNYRQTVPTDGSESDLYVTAAGDDTNGDGSVGNPFATIQRALQVVPMLNDRPNRVTINIGAGTFEFPQLLAANYTNIHGTTSVSDTLTISTVVAATDTAGIVLDVTGVSVAADDLRGSRITWTSGTSNGNTGWIYRNDATAGTTRIYATQDSGGTTGIQGMAASDTIDILSLDTTVTYNSAAIVKSSVQLNIRDLVISATAATSNTIINTDKIDYDGVYFDGTGGFYRGIRVGGFGRAFLTDCYYAAAGFGTEAFLALTNNGYLQITQGTVLDAELNTTNPARRFVEASAGSLLGFRQHVVARGFNDGEVILADGLGIFQVAGISPTTVLLVEDQNGASTNQVGPVFQINSTGEGQGGWFQLPNIHGSITGDYLVEATGGAWCALGGTDSLTTNLGTNTISADGGVSTVAQASDTTYIQGGSTAPVGFGVMPPVVFRPQDSQPPTTNPATLSTRNTTRPHPLLEFDQATNESTDFAGFLPSTYKGGDVTVTLVWCSTASLGDVVWDVAWEREDDGTYDLDNPSFAAAQSATDTAPGAQGVLVYTTITFTNAEADSIAAGECFRLQVERDASNGSDTNAGDAQLIRVIVEEAL